MGKTITVLVPAGSCLDEIEIQMAAGAFQADVMRAKEISLEAKAGVVEVGQAEAESLKLEVDTGQILCGADVAREVSADSELGEILLKLKGKERILTMSWSARQGSLSLKTASRRSIRACIMR